MHVLGKNGLFERLMGRRKHEEPVKLAPPPPPKPKRMTVEAFGEKMEIGLPVHPDGSLVYTPEEIGRMTIRCATCGDPIFIGAPVVISELEGEKLEKARQMEGVHFLPDEPTRAITCYTISECTFPGMLSDGRWLPNPDQKGEGMFVPSR